MTIPVYVRSKTGAPTRSAQAQRADAPVHPAAETMAEDHVWALVVDKMTQTALSLILVKLLAGWAIVYFWNIPMNNRWIWGFVPYVGLGATDVQYRTVAAWSSSAVAIFAAVWTLWHFLCRRRHHQARVWSAASALPMTALLAVFEWMRRHSADHVLPTNWLLRILFVVAVAAVLFAGFVENPFRRRHSEDAPGVTSSPVPHPTAQP